MVYKSHSYAPHSAIPCKDNREVYVLINAMKMNQLLSYKRNMGISPQKAAVSKLKTYMFSGYVCVFLH
jgi:uncharacterized protein YpmB